MNPELDNLDVDQQAAEPVLKLELTVNEANLVMGALQELPHRVVDGLLRKIIGQAQGQLGN